MKNEVIDKLSALAIAAFGLVAALAWNGAIKTIFERYYGVGEGVMAMLIYAVVVTLVAVFATLLLGRFSEKTKQIKVREQLEFVKSRTASLRKKR